MPILSEKELKAENARRVGTNRQRAVMSPSPTAIFLSLGIRVLLAASTNASADHLTLKVNPFLKEKSNDPKLNAINPIRVYRSMEESKNLSRFDDEGEKIDAAKLTPKEAEAITLDLLHQIKEQQQKKGFSLSEFSLQAKSFKKAEAAMAASVKPMASLSNKKDKPERAQSLTAFEPANASRGSSAPTAHLSCHSG